MYVNDINQLTLNVAFGNVKKPDIVNNIYYIFVIKYINSVRSAKSPKELKEFAITAEKYCTNNSAEILFYSLLVLETNPDGFVDLLCKECNVDLDNDSDFMILQQEISIANEMVMKNSINLSNEEFINSFVDCAKEFHILCVNNTNDYSPNIKSHNKK